MNKRQFLKVLPLAALTATTVKLDNVEAQVHELKPEKKYLILIPNAEPEDWQAIKSIGERLGENVTIVGGIPADGMKVYELQ